VWTADIRQRKPVFTHPNSVEFNAALKGGVSYVPALRRYVLGIYHDGPGGLGIFDAPEPWGPWTSVAYYDNWNGYGNKDDSAGFAEGLGFHVPTKWLSADGKTWWVVYSVYGQDVTPGAHDRFTLVRARVTLAE
jgi:hypothetical protein